jgi:hypothetical protein
VDQPADSGGPHRAEHAGDAAHVDILETAAAGLARDRRQVDDAVRADHRRPQAGSGLDIGRERMHPIRPFGPARAVP